MKFLSLCIILAGFSLSTQAQKSYFQIDMGDSLDQRTSVNLQLNTKTQSSNIDWHLAFDLSAFGGSVLVNEALGMKAYLYPKADITAYGSIDTSGFSTWKPLYNADTNWSFGALSRYKTSVFDLGWGIYNQTTHTVSGDSIYLLAMPNGDMFQFAIPVLRPDQTYILNWANVDGTGMKTDSISKNAHGDRNFTYYNMDSQNDFDNEPIITDWELIFNQYTSEEINATHNQVIGVQNNFDVEIAMVSGVDSNFLDYSSANFQAHHEGIGHNWNWYDSANSSYKLKDSIVYFVKDLNGHMHRLFFTAISADGRYINFTTEKLSGLGILEGNESIHFYPNPSLGNLNLTTSITGLVQIFDLAGSKQLELKLNNEKFLDISSLNSGAYILLIKTKKGVQTQKIIKY